MFDYCLTIVWPFYDFCYFCLLNLRHELYIFFDTDRNCCLLYFKMAIFSPEAENNIKF